MMSTADRTVSAACLTVRSLSWALLATVITGAIPLVHAGQVALDGKLGTSGMLALTGPNFDITASMGKIKGKNLFYSFSNFGLDTGETATFSGPSSIRNILTRTTGGNPSSIDGTIRSEIVGATFFS